MRLGSGHPWVAGFLAASAAIAAAMSTSDTAMLWPIPGPTSVEDARWEQLALRVLAAVLLSGAAMALVPRPVGRVLAGIGLALTGAAGVYLVLYALILDDSAWRFLTAMYLVPAGLVLVAGSLLGLRAIAKPPPIREPRWPKANEPRDPEQPRPDPGSAP